MYFGELGGKLKDEIERDVLYVAALMKHRLKQAFLDQAEKNHLNTSQTHQEIDEIIG